MKKIFFFLTMQVILNYCYGQNELPKDSMGNTSFSDVVLVDSVQKNELYNRAKFWAVNTFKNPQRVIQMDDRDNGAIVVKGATQISYHWIGLRFEDVYFSVSIFCKDFKYKYIITEVVLEHYKSIDGDYYKRTVTKKVDAEIKGEIKKEFQKIIASIKSSMTNPSEISKDW